MQVRLLTATENAVEAIATAAWICTQPDFPKDRSNVVGEKGARLIRKVLSSGHDSILEHASFSFAISGISRACSHQLVRHRIASYSQQSQRYVKADNPEIITPPSIASALKNNQGRAELWQEYLQANWSLYAELVDAGIPPEDARFVLPNAAATKLVMTMNARELHHFFSLRCCTRAQWEIRNLANMMLKLCRDEAPVLFENCGPGCVRGTCPEGQKSCGGML